MTSSNTYLYFNGNCEEALNLYVKVLGARIGFMMKTKDAPKSMECDADMGEGVMHATLMIGETKVLVSDVPPSYYAKPQGFNINVNGHEIHNKGDNLPKAEITPQGDLLIEGTAVDVTPAQRQELLAYRGRIIGIAEAGMAIGGKGADLAGEALGGVVGAIFGGKEGEKAFEQRMEAQGKQIEAEAMKLCTQLPGLLSSQQALAASLPEFKPYARMTQEDIDDCGKDHKGNGVAVTSG